MIREQTLKALCKADCFQWRILGNMACDGACRANDFQLEMRHGRQADALSPTDGAAPEPSKGQAPPNSPKEEA